MLAGSMRITPSYCEYFGSMQYRLVDSKFGQPYFPQYGPITLEQHNEQEKQQGKLEQIRIETKTKIEYEKCFTHAYLNWDLSIMKEAIETYDFEILNKELYPSLKQGIKHFEFLIECCSYNGEVRKSNSKKLEECKCLMKLIERKNPFAENTVEENPNTTFIKDIIKPQNIKKCIKKKKR
jgi:hypothetical protein